MPRQYRHRRSSNPANIFPTPLEPGEIAVNTANRQLALGDADGASLGVPLPLLALRFFDARAQYVLNDHVIQAGVIYRANGAITPGAFNAANWTAVSSDTAAYVLKTGSTMTGHLALPVGPAAAEAVRRDYVDAALAALPAATFIGDVPPGSPTAGQLYWQSSSGVLFIYYNDGNTSQWVTATVAPVGATGAQGPPCTVIIAGGLF